MTTLMTVLKRAWKTWLKIAHVIGTFQARVILSVFYFVVVPGFAVIVKTFRDPLDLRAHFRPTFWVERATLPADFGRRQS